ncbi:MAG: hypothetical protein AUJ72_04550 [Candidatus Omnitrophica bacterium CG1_02_46_14]|nr:MAG: hypothetical protein AUJ72_04550 [Candidatus Omnitrophica bacterium CG1_02_46_14]
MDISAEITPNPNTLKFNVNKTLLKSGSVNFPDKEKARGALLPEMLFQIENVLGVMIGPTFITITKNPASEWSLLVPAVTEKIKTLLNSDKVLFPQWIKTNEAPKADPAVNSEIERKIREVLDHEIRPAVAMDGGDITFYGYDNGIVTLHLQGSCSTCPSSIMTLKMGVENRLKSLIPEVREVVQV